MHHWQTHQYNKETEINNGPEKESLITSNTEVMTKTKEDMSYCFATYRVNIAQIDIPTKAKFKEEQMLNMKSIKKN